MPYNRIGVLQPFFIFVYFAMIGEVMPREGSYQKHIINTLKDIFPDCVVLKNDATYQQGIPDLIILWNDRWAMLEVKPYADARRQPNQDWWVDALNEMSFAAYIYPDNESVVLDALQRSFTSRRPTLVSKRQR